MEPILAFADDNYDIKTNKDKSLLVEEIDKSLEDIAKWLKQAGLKVNHDKTYLRFYHQIEK
jgi:hypothetical protein